MSLPSAAPAAWLHALLPCAPPCANHGTIPAAIQGKRTALILAASCGMESCVGMLLAWGADAAAKDEVRPLSGVVAATAAKGARTKAATGGALPSGWQHRGGAGWLQHRRHQRAAGRGGTGGGEEGASTGGRVGVGCRCILVIVLCCLQAAWAKMDSAQRDAAMARWTAVAEIEKIGVRRFGQQGSPVATSSAAAASVAQATSPQCAAPHSRAAAATEATVRCC